MCGLSRVWGGVSRYIRLFLTFDGFMSLDVGENSVILVVDVSWDR